MPNITNILSDTLTLAATIALLVSLVYCCLYYGLIHFRVGRWHRKAKPGEGTGILSQEDLPPVSVVLTAHNDAEWLRENLVYLLEQDYPQFEVVVVDYLSRDDTQFVLKLLHDMYPHLKVVPFREDVNLFQGKKYPLSIGIKSASNDILILADPDCTPDPDNLTWLRGMVRGYRKADTQIVLGFCGVKRKKNLLGMMQIYDNLAYSSLYLGTALMGHPFTGSGRNLSYRRDFFFKQGAFISHYDVADGSDDLFIYQNATRNNTEVCIDANALLYTEPKPSFTAWHQERLHRVGTRNRHTWRGRFVEEVLPLCNLLFYASAIWLLVSALPLWPVVAAAVAIKWSWQSVCFAQLCNRFKGGKTYLAAPLLEIYFIVANTILILLPLQNNRKFKTK